MFVVNQGNYTVLKCPVGLDCGEILEIDACRQIVPRYLISMWDDPICECMLDASQKFYCPYKDCSGWRRNDKGGGMPFLQEIAVLCSVMCHGILEYVGCEVFKGIDQNERGVKNLIVHQLAKEMKRQRCPSCRIFVENSEGCACMSTCRCGFQICYACGGTWTSSHGCC